MPKLKVLSRDLNDYVASRKGDIDLIQKNPKPTLHPFERPIEYTRALNAVKLDKVFAKPFVGNLDGHKDGVYCLRKHPSILSYMLSGSCDGEIRIWNLRTQTPIFSYKDAHSGFVRGLTVVPSGDRFLSCGDDKTVKLWEIPSDDKDQDLSYISECLSTFIGEGHFTGIDHQRNSSVFGTSGERVDIWDYERADPITNFSWGADSIAGLKFNPVETFVLASFANDRNVCLYDIRSSSPIRKMILTMRTNALCWNPMEPFIFSLANEDHNSYTFDMRNLEQAITIHKDHVQAVLDLDYSPTGKEFVTGSYDRTVRIFGVDQRYSREVYHTKRMQRIFAVQYSADASYVLSASEEMNIRIWKANASAPIGNIHPRRKLQMKYQEKLKERYKYLPEIRRISKHRHLPKAIKVAIDQKRAHNLSVRRKFQNVRKHAGRHNKVKFIKEAKRSVEEVEL